MYDTLLGGMMKTTKFLLFALGLCACQGQLNLSDDDGPVIHTDVPESPGEASPDVQPQAPWDGGGPGVETVDEIAVDGLRRLTRDEVRYSLLDAIGIDPGTMTNALPLDIGGTTVFDNVVASQSISAIEISEYQSFAEAYAAEVAAADIPSELGECTPSGPDDLGCLTAVTERLGALLFRRAYTTTEAERVASSLIAFAVEDDDFATGVELVVTYFVLHPEFLYRAESPDALDGYALATRLSYLLWGSGPDDELLLAAESGTLVESAERRAQARRMLADDRAKRQWRRFHAMWLGYADHTLPDNLADDMLAETNALVDRVVFDGDWLDLLRADETHVTPELAEFYGLAAPASADWVSYDARRGGGVLSHATVLNHGHKGGNFGDTSPTMRGYELYKRLSCGTFGGIPADVDPDNPPGSASDCKADAYDMRSQAACASCHAITDGIGFGLENFGVHGQWRDEEPGKNGCTIDGAGDFAGAPFQGPAELGVLLAEDPAVTLCANRQLFRFAMGRLETAADEPAIRALASSHQAHNNLTDILVELVASPAFLTTGVAP